MSESMLLQSLLTATKDGDWGKDEPQEGYLPYYVIRGTDFASVAQGDVGSVPLRFLPARTVSRRHLEVNDILIETAGGSRDRPTGRTMLVTEQVLAAFDEPVTCASFARFLRVDQSAADARYVFRFLQYLYATRQIEQYQVQHTGVARFQYTQFAATQAVPLPSLGQQRAIAEVLGALDDKIAANRKLAETADELAIALFTGAKRKSVGARSTFEDLATISGGGTPRTSVEEYWDGEVNWATPTDVTGLSAPYLSSTARTITDAGLSNCSSALYPAGSILMTSRATIGAFAIAEVPTAVNQGFIVVNAREAHNHWWLFHDMRSRVSEFVAHANGATFLELPRGRFKSLPVSLPDAETVERFSEEVGALHVTASAAQRESVFLTTLRDTLLPRLMSGELRVRDAERAVEAAL